MHPRYSMPGYNMNKKKSGVCKVVFDILVRSV